jgi:ABC-type phosphate transport system substrate-binding protein
LSFGRGVAASDAVVGPPASPLQPSAGGPVVQSPWIRLEAHPPTCGFGYLLLPGEFGCQGTVDFANTEIPFQNPPEPGQQAEIPSRPYAYLPIVAGGTSFMYNLTVGGQRVTDLRLSGPTLAKIFTGQITRWNDPAITHDYGKTLPNIPIIPVVRSDGAGASAQFSLYMQSQAPSIYCPFIRSKLHLSGSACPSVSFYPAFGSSKAQNGSNCVANYVSASYGAGAIGYVEYAYAKRISFPVVSLLNKAGYFAQPSAGNVAVALTRAKINPNLTQNLASVYTNPDKRAYPMSSYSYMVVPTSTAAPFNTDKGRPCRRSSPTSCARVRRRPPSSATRHCPRTSSRRGSNRWRASRGRSRRPRSASATTRP